MATLSALAFGDASLAEAAVPALEDAQLKKVLKVEDAALVTWPTSRRLPRARQLVGLELTRSLSPEFWQLFFASTWLLPVALQALGTPSLRSHSLEAFGIEDRFVQQLRRSMTAGASALVLLTPDATPDRVVKTFRALDFTLLSASLTDRQHGALLAAFGVADDDARVEESPSTAAPGVER